MVADILRSIIILAAGCSVLTAEQPVGIVASDELRQPIPQYPLRETGRGTAIIFIGGIGDEISGIIPHMFRTLPPVTGEETRAYYHWHAGHPGDQDRGAAELAEHIAAFRQSNPRASVVLIGHSMGASLALKTAQLLSSSDGRVMILTLDPVDRSYTPKRPKSVTWWGNAYVVNSLSAHDFIACWGGRWNECPQADVNICFDGRQLNEHDYHYIHDDALALMLSKRTGSSLYEGLQAALNMEEK